MIKTVSIIKQELKQYSDIVSILYSFAMNRFTQTIRSYEMKFKIYEP